MEQKNIFQKLINIQLKLKIPKNRVNNFAKKPFNYRNVEDILSAVKPIAAEEGCVILLDDEPILVGDRNYIKAVAILSDGTETIKVSASARECASRSGFDEAQLTGSASSYARKYALNGLLGLDDNEDPDHKDNSKIQRGSLSCPVCGSEVEGYTGKSGIYYSPQDVINKFGMCCGCYREQRNNKA